jgi:hypothetical protein
MGSTQNLLTYSEEIEMNKIFNNAKNACALALATVAMGLGAVESVISIPANIAGWGAEKLFWAANKLAGQEAHEDTGEKIISEIDNIDAE